MAESEFGKLLKKAGQTGNLQPVIDALRPHGGTTTLRNERGHVIGDTDDNDPISASNWRELFMASWDDTLTDDQIDEIAEKARQKK